MASRLRPNIPHLLTAYSLLAHYDFVRAKARWAADIGGICPSISDNPIVEWWGAKHPLLLRSLRAQGRNVVPLDIRLVAPEARILLISGPNAGGKSVCLKTVGLLQYLVQCGVPVPMADHSSVGIFDRLYIDIGDEQSIEDDLSTYSSHLRNMKHFVREGGARSLLLIDEFGGGTEPRSVGLLHKPSYIASMMLAPSVSSPRTIRTSRLTPRSMLASSMGRCFMTVTRCARSSASLLVALVAPSPIEIARKIGLPEEVISEVRETVGAELHRHGQVPARRHT